MPVVNLAHMYWASNAAPPLHRVTGMLGVLCLVDALTLLAAYSVPASVTHEEVDAAAEVAGDEGLARRLAASHSFATGLLVAALTSQMLTYMHLAAAAEGALHAMVERWWVLGRYVLGLQFGASLAGLLCTFHAHQILFQVKFPESVTSDVRDGMGTDPSDPLQATRLAQLLALLLPLALMLVLLSGAATYSQQAVRDGTRQQRVRTEAELQDAARDVICYASRKQQQLMGQSSSVQVDAHKSYGNHRLLPPRSVGNLELNIMNQAYNLEESGMSAKFGTAQEATASARDDVSSRASVPRDESMDTLTRLLREALNEAEVQRGLASENMSVCSNQITPGSTSRIPSPYCDSPRFSPRTRPVVLSEVERRAPRSTSATSLHEQIAEEIETLSLEEGSVGAGTSLGAFSNLELSVGNGLVNEKKSPESVKAT